jgi:DNA topoisomerase VI subunit A
MSKETFTTFKMRKANLEKLNVINSIIDEYLAHDYKLTLRQLYYQLVSRDIIPNNKKEYNKLSELLKNGRMSGLVDWDAIEDRGRVPYIPYYCDSVSDALKDTADSYRLNRQIGQEVYVEVWSEKDALSGILKRVTSHYHVRLVINKGYSSCSAMREAYKRFKIWGYRKKCVILYLGDHDPSGLDMVRDIRHRLAEFGITDSLTVKPIALTTEQVQLYTPPENKLKEDDYGKLKDPRGKIYFEKFGNASWEVDALNPEILTALLHSEIRSVIDVSKFNDVIEKEVHDQKELLDIAKTVEMDMVGVD